MSIRMWRDQTQCEWKYEIITQLCRTTWQFLSLGINFTSIIQQEVGFQRPDFSKNTLRNKLSSCSLICSGWGGNNMNQLGTLFHSQR